MSLKHDIQELTDNQVIDQETADRIIQYYQSRKRSINISAIISTVAAIFVGLGVISILAYNWDDLPKFIRLLLGLIPLCAATYGCYYALTKKADKKPWMEAMAILQTLAYAASFAIVNQIYQMQFDSDSFFFICMLFSLPFMFLMRSATLSTLIIVSTCLYIGSADDTFQIISTIIIVLADIAFLYLYYFKEKEDFLFRLRINLMPFILIALGIKVREVLGIKLHEEEYYCLALLYSSCFYVAHTWIAESKKTASKGRLYKVAFYLLFFPCILCLSSLGNPRDHFNILRIVSATLPILLSAGFKLKEKKNIQWQEWIGLPFALFVTIPMMTPDVFSILSLGIIGYTIYDSCKDYDLLKMNCGLIALFAWTFIVLVKHISEFYIFGFVLILMGIALFLMNKFLIDKKRSHEHTENK